MEAYPMNAGDGPYSYAKNSFPQASAVASVRELVHKGIVEKLDIQKSSSSSVFRIADFGCSVGPNTFSAVQNMVDAVKSKFQILADDSHTLQFHVIFNDHESNDFNALFKTLPPDRQYFAASAPGSFHSQVLPDGSLDVAHSSTALHWLSKVPEQLLDRNSDAFNKGRTFYCDAPDAVIHAFKNQFEEDMKNFLHSRAQELAQGGLIALVFPARANGCSHSKCGLTITCDFLGSCIMDLASKATNYTTPSYRFYINSFCLYQPNAAIHCLLWFHLKVQGVIDEEKANSFNLPTYFASADELVEVVHKNGYFTIEEMKEVPQARVSLLSVAQFHSATRAVFENVIRAHFGESITEEIFKLYLKKLEDPQSYGYSIADCEKSVNLFALLKRK